MRRTACIIQTILTNESSYPHSMREWMDGTVKYARAASPVVAHFAEHFTAEALTLAYRKEKIVSTAFTNAITMS